MTRPSEPPSTSAKSPKKGRALRILVQLLIGLALGLVLVEVGFSMRDEGAFPHLNLYAEDAELGARLRPSSSQRFKFQDNDVTDISIGADGLRNPAPSAREHAVLVVGDSQVFGLGVNDDETMPAQLAALSGRPVINAGVPTYGPLEFNAVVREQLEEGGIETVVYVVNFANDAFETERPNRERHVIWDGWAVRAETAPPEAPTNFPGRFWLYNQSHAFYAARRLWHETTVESSDDRGFASEGTWRDLALAGESSARTHEEGEALARNEVETLRTRIAETQQEQAQRHDALARALIDNARDLEALAGGDADEPGILFEVIRHSAGDIVSGSSGEEGAREARVTAAYMQRGARFRSTLLERYGERPSVRGALDQLDTSTRARLDALAAVPSENFVPSVLSPRIEEVATLCAQHNVKLVVVALPLDVMVAPEEWAKYGETEPPDISEASVLLSDLVETAHRMGVRAVDVTEALRNAERPTFQRGDFHLTANGHRAFAAAVYATIESVPPPRRPSLALAEGRSNVPEPEDFHGVAEATVRGSSAAGCATYFVREWLRVSCFPARSRPARHFPLGAQILSGEGGETFTLVTHAGVSVLAPRPLRGEPMRIRFDFTNGSHVLVLPSGNDPAYFEPLVPAPTSLPVPSEYDPLSEALCRCHRFIHRESLACVGVPVDSIEWCEPSCVSAYGTANPACMSSEDVARVNAMREQEHDYTRLQGELLTTCSAALACVRGRIDAIGTCPEGQAHAFATRRCFPLCSTEVPCSEGVCVPAGGASVCVAMSSS